MEEFQTVDNQLFSWIITIYDSCISLYNAYHSLYSGVEYLIYVATVAAAGSRVNNDAWDIDEVLVADGSWQQQLTTGKCTSWGGRWWT